MLRRWIASWIQSKPNTDFDEIQSQIISLKTQVRHLDDRVVSLRAKVFEHERTIASMIDVQNINWKDGEQYRWINGVKVFRDYAAYVED